MLKNTVGLSKKMKAAAIVAAAGTGLRMKNETRKQYLILAGKPVLARSLNLFTDYTGFETVIAVIPPGDEELVKKLIEPYCPVEQVALVAGGNSRQESVRRGLALVPDWVELVCIHDAARPLASPALLKNLLSAAEDFGAAIPVIAVSDTVKEIDNEGFVTATTSRDRLRLVQTPQIFRSEILKKAFEMARQSGFEATDDASLVEAAGFAVKTIPGETANLKITTPLDLVMAMQLLKGVDKR
jgi:2-C-methyl-D-erythritol 4-phosphate cytidylyltransferase